MKLRKKRYIYFYFKNLNYSKFTFYYSFFFYYIFIVSFFFKFLFYYYFIKKYYFVKKINFFLHSNILYTFKKKNTFILLKNLFFISNGFLNKNSLKKKNFFIFFNILKNFYYSIVYLLKKKINLIYLNISKKILISYNFSSYFFKKLNKNIFKINHFKINNIFIKEKKIFGYMRKKKYPRRKKFLTKKKFFYLMFLKKYKPKNNSLRDKILLILKKYLKFKRLLLRLKKNVGKNNTGHITIKYKGGGNFYKYRIIDSFFYKYNYIYKCIGFDKSRYTNSLLSLLKSEEGVVKYTISPVNLDLQKSIKTTFFFINNKDSLGNAIPVGWIPNNTLIYNLENHPFLGAKLIKSAGTFGKIISHTKNKVKILLPSKKKNSFLNTV